jgi:hypothetical protein
MPVLLRSAWSGLALDDPQGLFRWHLDISGMDTSCNGVLALGFQAEAWTRAVEKQELSVGHVPQLQDVKLLQVCQQVLQVMAPEQGFRRGFLHQLYEQVNLVG